MVKENLSIINFTKGKLPALPFALIKKDILGEKYQLSIAFISPQKSKNINKTYRGKDYSTNILSFPFSKKDGEILLCPSIIRKETKKFGKNYRELLGYLVIHGMLHLKGMQHSSKMDKAEQKYDKKYFRRN